MASLARPLRYSGLRPALVVTAPAVLAAIVLALACSGCGSGGSDNGQVLRAVGFFTGVSGNPPTQTANVPETGRSVSLSTALAVPNGAGDGGYAGLENLQTTGAVSTDAAQISYKIAGSSFVIPSDVFVFSVLLPPQSDSTGNVLFTQLQLVSPALMDFLRTNAGSLPPPPFTMIITVAVQGHTEAGMTVSSNQLDYNLTFTD